MHSRVSNFNEEMHTFSADVAYSQVWLTPIQLAPFGKLGMLCSHAMDSTLKPTVSIDDDKKS
jgi:hypothetical protein